LEDLKLSANFQASAKNLYDAWLSSNIHSDFTGENAEIEPRIGGKFNVADGYITGTNLVLQPYGRIVQSWRTTEFPDYAPDSRLEILIEKHNSGAKLTLIHSMIPEGQKSMYQKGWKDHYLKPLKKYFQNKKK